jgi:hypothetical protein
MDDMEQFRYVDNMVTKPELSAPPRRKPRTKQVGGFIRGPIPLEWIIRAARIPRRNAVLVGLVLHYLSGLRNERDGLVLTVRRCQPFGLGRKGVQRGLADLEAAGLIRVSRTAGQSPRVDIVST